MATKHQLLDKQDDIILKIRELQEDLRVVQGELNQKQRDEDSKPQIVYNNYTRW